MSRLRQNLDSRDYVFFDLDPSKGRRFSTVATVARALRAKLSELGLEFLLQTSRATGLYLYPPLAEG